MQSTPMTWLTMVAALCCASAHFIPRPQQRQDPSNQDTMTLCGRHLAEARMLFCYERGYALSKKSVRSNMNELSRFEERNEDGPEDYFRYWPWLERSRAKALAMEGRGKRDHGLVDECCLKPCTLDELLNYC